MGLVNKIYRVLAANGSGALRGPVLAPLRPPRNSAVAQKGAIFSRSDQRKRPRRGKEPLGGGQGGPPGGPWTGTAPRGPQFDGEITAHLSRTGRARGADLSEPATGRSPVRRGPGARGGKKNRGDPKIEYQTRGRRSPGRSPVFFHPADPGRRHTRARTLASPAEHICPTAEKG